MSSITMTVTGSALPHSSSAAPNQQPQANSNDMSSTAQASSLYLYTFLATLVLLLGVSSAVVLRSITLRVRQRRAIEEAIRNGTYVAPDARVGSFLRGMLAQKPVLHDAYLATGANGNTYGKEVDDEGLTKEKDGWSGIMPVAVSLVTKNDSQNATPLPAPSVMQIRRQTTQIGFFAGLYSLWSERPSAVRRRAERAERAARATAAQTGTGSVGASEEKQRAPTPDPPPALRVAVLIAMPDPSRSASAQRRGSDFSTTETLVSGDSRRPSTASTSTSSSSSLDADVKGKGRDMMPPIADAENEESVPYLEFGVAEIPITDIKSSSTT
ncbi:hypothetical protein SCHPADRAFT_924762 [Schizopora paradoxa]|uniref:Uncharacterized protein n=1 Tax=Schizopora paradoxa TaxID=27342 RepID=A0A0H2SAW5_9AGAM|nr:hypothetical protein SCHPADRAFT_924762 [Schizopora paradoxa]